MSQKVLVVGAAGYIGEGVARAFRLAGYRVYGVFRKESQRAALIKQEIIPVQGSLEKPEDLKALILECSIIIDAVYLPGHSHAFFKYVRSLRGTAIESSKVHYIQTSGIMIYSTGTFREGLQPVDESLLPTPTDTFEMVPKKQLEDEVLAAHDVRTTVIRPGFVYGSHGGAIAPLFFEVDPKGVVLIEGRPDKRWSWVHQDDLGEGYVAVAKAGSVVNNQVFNISAQDCPTYEELKLRCAAAAGWKLSADKSNVKYAPLPESEHRRANWETNVIINPAKSYDLLKWRPRHVGVLNEIETYFAAYKAHK